MIRKTALGLALFGALGPAAFVADAQPPGDPPPAGPSSAVPTPAASAGTSPSFAFDLPTAKSPAPTATEWASAKGASLTRNRARCQALRVREWLRVRCTGETFAVSLLGGSNDGLAFWIGEHEGRPFGEVQMPVRLGDRRVVQLWKTGTDAAGASVIEPSVVIQELWLEGDAAPIVTVL